MAKWGKGALGRAQSKKLVQNAARQIARHAFPHASSNHLLGKVSQSKHGKSTFLVALVSGLIDVRERGAWMAPGRRTEGAGVRILPCSPSMSVHFKFVLGYSVLLLKVP